MWSHLRIHGSYSPSATSLSTGQGMSADVQGQAKVKTRYVQGEGQQHMLKIGLNATINDMTPSAFIRIFVICYI